MYSFKKLLLEREQQANVGTINSKLFPTKLSQVDPDLAKTVATAGMDDKIDGDDKRIAKRVDVNFSAPAAQLKPTQSEIIVNKAISIALSMLNSGKIGGQLSAIISGDNQVMDGHHRWAGTILVHPKATVGGLKINLPGDILIGILNVATKGIFGRTTGNPGKGNISDFTSTNVLAALKLLMEKGTKLGIFTEDGQFSEKEISGEDVKKLLAKMSNATSAEDGAQQMARNADLLPKQIPGWAPERIDMPVIESDELKTLIQHFQSGMFDNVKPYSSQLAKIVGEE